MIQRHCCFSFAREMSFEAGTVIIPDSCSFPWENVGHRLIWRSRTGSHRDTRCVSRFGSTCLISRPRRPDKSLGGGRVMVPSRNGRRCSVASFKPCPSFSFFFDHRRPLPLCVPHTISSTVVLLCRGAKALLPHKPPASIMGSYENTLSELKQAIADLPPKDTNKKVLIYLTKQLTQEIQGEAQAISGPSASAAAHVTVPPSLGVNRSSLHNSSSKEPNSQSAVSHGKRLWETDSPEDNEGMQSGQLSQNKLD